MFEKEFDEKYDRITKIISLYNSEVEKSIKKRNPNKFLRVVVIAVIVFMAIYYYLDIMVQNTTDMNTRAASNSYFIQLKYWVPIIGIFILFAFVRPRSLTAKLVKERTAWLRPKIMPVLFPNFTYYIKPQDDISTVMRMLYPDSEISYYGCLGNSSMIIYDLLCKGKEVIDFSGLMFFANSNTLTETVAQEIIKMCAGFPVTCQIVSMEEGYSILILHGASLDNTLSNVLHVMDKSEMFCNYRIISSVDEVITAYVLDNGTK